MSEHDMNKGVKVGEDTVTLADLAGITLDDIAEKRGESLAKGFYDFEVDAEEPPHLMIINADSDKAKIAVKFKFKVLDVVSVSDPDFSGQPTDLIGKNHFETFFLAGGDIKADEALGYLKAFMKDIGAANTGKPLKDLLTDCAGIRFSAPIGKRKNPNDTDQVFTNIQRGKIKPIISTVSDVAKAVA